MVGSFVLCYLDRIVLALGCLASAWVLMNPPWDSRQPLPWPLLEDAPLVLMYTPEGRHPIGWLPGVKGYQVAVDRLVLELLAIAVICFLGIVLTNLLRGWREIRRNWAKK